MKNSGFIIKIAIAVAAVAAVFSLVTLIRSIIIGSSMVFPVIQLVGSGAIFAVCFLMFRALRAGDEDDAKEDKSGDDTEKPVDDESKAQAETPADDPTDAQTDAKDAEKEIDELYKKYDLSDFEES